MGCYDRDHGAWHRKQAKLVKRINHRSADTVGELRKEVELKIEDELQTAGVTVHGRDTRRGVTEAHSANAKKVQAIKGNYGSLGKLRMW
jgi:hypothetical protein